MQTPESPVIEKKRAMSLWSKRRSTVFSQHFNFISTTSRAHCDIFYGVMILLFCFHGKRVTKSGLFLSNKDLEINRATTMRTIASH
jgi:hypothetical protein